MEIEGLLLKWRGFWLGHSFSEICDFSLHFDYDFFHLEIGALSVLCIHVDFCDQTQNLIGSINIGDLAEYALDFC